MLKKIKEKNTIFVASEKEKKLISKTIEEKELIPYL